MTDLILMNRLKELRARHGLTQSALAEAVGVTRKSVNTIENRIFTPSALLAFKLANALDASVEDVFWLAEAKK